MLPPDRRTDAEIVEQVLLNVEAALELARVAEQGGTPVTDDAVNRLGQTHARLLRDGLRSSPEGVLF
jgi:hypothetical protein